jgi:lipid-A-disaccharide synthase-like uncharacterized protein
MTITEFSKIAERKLSDKIIDFSFCIIAILMSSFFILKFSEIQMNQNNWLPLSFMYMSFFLLISLAIYGLVIILKPLNVSCMKNEILKAENLKLIEKIYHSLNGKDIETEDNVIKFTFKKSFWSYKQRINLLAEDNLLAVYVKNIDSNPKGGFLDFGARARLQKKVLNMLEQASR